MSEHFLELYQEALAGLKTGGMTLEASLQDIEEGKRQAIAGGQQALVSGGLSGTTMAAGVPIQAEKIAARQRLGARGQAEQTYLTTLASFAAFSQRGVEAQKQRDWEAEQAKIARDASWTYATRVDYGDSGGIASGGTGGGGGGYAQQFPSIYDQGGGIGTAPSLTGGGDAWEVFGDQYQLTYGGGRKETISGERYDVMKQAGQLPGGGAGDRTGWQDPPTKPAGPGFTYTWIGGPEGHYTIGSTPGSTGKDIGMEGLTAFADSWLKQGPTPGGGF